MKREKKIDKKFKFSEDTKETISEVKGLYNTKSDSLTIEEAIKRTAINMGIEIDQTIIRNEMDLLNFYKKTAINGKIMTITETKDLILLSKNTIQTYRKKLVNGNKLRKEKKSLYIVEDEK